MESLLRAVMRFYEVGEDIYFLALDSYIRNSSSLSKRARGERCALLICVVA